MSDSPARPCIVAVDAGGTSTRAALVRADGTCLASARLGAGNPISAGPEAAWAQVRNAVERVVAVGERVGARPELTLIAMAGNTRSGSSSVLETALAEGGLHAPIVYESDVLSAYCSGSAAPQGYVLIAGTGAVSARVSRSELVQVADGAGWLLGDQGSGFWIGRRVAAAVMAELDGRGPRTALTPALLAHIGADASAPGPHRSGRWGAAALTLIDHVYGRRPVSLAALAPLAFAADEDEVARGIVADAATELLRTLGAVWEGPADATIVLAGGLLAGDTPLARLVQDGLPSPRWVQVPGGLAGSVVLALRHLGVPVDTPLLRTIQLGLLAQS